MNAEYQRLETEARVVHLKLRHLKAVFERTTFGSTAFHELTDLIQRGLFAGAEDIDDFGGGACGAEAFGDECAFIQQCRDDCLEPLMNARLTGGS